MSKKRYFIIMFITNDHVVSKLGHAAFKQNYFKLFSRLILKHYIFHFMSTGFYFITFFIHSQVANPSDLHLHLMTIWKLGITELQKTAQGLSW